MKPYKLCTAFKFFKQLFENILINMQPMEYNIGVDIKLLPCSYGRYILKIISLNAR